MESKRCGDFSPIPNQQHCGEFSYTSNYCKQVMENGRGKSTHLEEYARTRLVKTSIWNWSSPLVLTKWVARKIKAGKRIEPSDHCRGSTCLIHLLLAWFKPKSCCSYCTICWRSPFSEVQYAPLEFFCISRPWSTGISWTGSIVYQGSLRTSIVKTQTVGATGKFAVSCD